MGCDIHLVLEKKHPDFGWIGLHSFSWDILFATTAQRFSVNFPARDRNYKRFSMLAGVRGKGPEPKGLPDDASQLTKMELGEDNDLHSHTWYPLAEAARIFSETEYVNPITAMVAAKLTDQPPLQDPVIRYFGIESYEGDPIENYRLCIAFDN